MQSRISVLFLINAIVCRENILEHRGKRYPALSGGINLFAKGFGFAI